MADIEKLKILLDGIVNDPALRPVKDANGNIVTTKCNIAVQKVLAAFGYKKMDGMLADKMCDFMDKQKEWISVNSGIAKVSVSRGQVGVAAHKYPHHGHVAMIAPGKEVYSGGWGCNCPIIANVGKENGYMGANFAFPITDTPPSYYLLNEGEIT